MNQAENHNLSKQVYLDFCHKLYSIKIAQKQLINELRDFEKFVLPKMAKLKQNLQKAQFSRSEIKK